MGVKPLRRRGTEAQRIRRIKKWARRDQNRMIARHYPGVWRLFLREQGFRRQMWIINRDGSITWLGAIHQIAIRHTVQL